METVKFALFAAMELIVVAAVAAVLIGGIYQIIRDRVRASRRAAKLATENR